MEKPGHPGTVAEGQVQHMFHADDKRAVIMEAALGVFASRGFHTSTVDQVAEAAGVAKGTIYLYFKSKNELLDQLVEGRIARLAGMVRQAAAGAPDACSKLRRIVAAHFDFYSTERRFMQLMAGQIGTLSPRFSATVLDGTRTLTAMVQDVLAQGIEEGSIVPAADAGTMAFALMGMVHAVAYRWLMSDTPQPPEEIAADVYAMFASGLQAAGHGATHRAAHEPH